MYTAQAEPIRHWSYYTIIHELVLEILTRFWWFEWFIGEEGRASLNICQCMEDVKYPAQGPFSSFLSAQRLLCKPQNRRRRESNIFWTTSKSAKPRNIPLMEQCGQITGSLVQSDISILLQHQLENILSNKFFSRPSSSRPTLVTYSLTMKTLPNQQKDNDKDKYKDKDNENDKYI